jgi:hypothetical protein
VGVDSRGKEEGADDISIKAGFESLYFINETPIDF